MNIRQTLQHIPRLFCSTRRQGHTHAMLHGALNSPNALIIAHDHKHASQIRRENPTIEAIPIDSLDAIYGRRGPVAFDHNAITQLCLAASNEIDSLDHRLGRLQGELADAVDRETQKDMKILELQERLLTATKRIQQIEAPET
jgi:hypothetical protein